MDERQYHETRTWLFILAGIAVRLDLEGFLQDIECMEAVGPTANPALYLQGREQLADLKALVQICKMFQDEVKRQKMFQDEVERQMGRGDGRNTG